MPISAPMLLRGVPFSIKMAVSFIALSRVPVLNSLVMMGTNDKFSEEAESEDDAIWEGAMEYVRPVLMAALIASFGLLQMALGTGTGTEAQRLLVTVVTGCVITATALTLTLLVLPAITARTSRRWTWGSQSDLRVGGMK